jgi:hypothetical protein
MAARPATVTRRKVGTLMDESLFRRLKMHAAERGRSVADVLEESVAGYLALHEGAVDERLAEFERFCSSPFPLTRAQLDTITEEDTLDQ